MQWLKTQNILSEKTNDYLYQIQELKNKVGLLESDIKCQDLQHSEELKCIEKRYLVESEGNKQKFDLKMEEYENKIQEYELKSRHLQDALDKERTSSHAIQDELTTLQWENADLTKVLNTDQCEFQNQKKEWKDLERKYQKELKDLYQEWEHKVYTMTSEHTRELEKQSFLLQEANKRNQTLSMELESQIPNYQQRVMTLESQLNQCMYKISQFESSTEQQLVYTQDLVRQNETLTTKLKSDRYNLTQRIQLQSAELEQKNGLLAELNHEVSRLLKDKEAHSQLLLASIILFLKILVFIDKYRRSRMGKKIKRNGSIQRYYIS